MPRWMRFAAEEATSLVEAVGLADGWWCGVGAAGRGPQFDLGHSATRVQGSRRRIDRAPRRPGPARKAAAADRADDSDAAAAGITPDCWSCPPDSPSLTRSAMSGSSTASFRVGRSDGLGDGVDMGKRRGGVADAGQVHDARRVGAGRVEARPHGVAQVVLAREQDDASRRRTGFGRTSVRSLTPPRGGSRAVPVRERWASGPRRV